MTTPPPSNFHTFFYTMTTVAQSFQPEAEPEFIPPTINDVRYGWGLSIDQLLEKLNNDSQWEYKGIDQDEDGGQELIYQHTTHGYWQGWGFDQAGQMQEIRLLIMPEMTHIVGAFLVGALWLGDRWIYLQDSIKQPEAERIQVFQGEYTGEFGLYTVLRVEFLPPYRGISVAK